jgi:hypothetical protein
MRWSALGCLLVAGLAVVQSGCLLVAAGAAGGAAVGYAYCKGKVCQAYNANVQDAWAATHTALGELALPVTSEERQATGGWIQSVAANGEKIRIDLDVMASQIPAEGPLTRICVRVGTFGDYPLSERILYQVDAHLVPSNLAPGAVPGVATPGSPAAGPVAPAGALIQTGEPPLLASPPARQP